MSGLPNQAGAPTNRCSSCGASSEGKFWSRELVGLLVFQFSILDECTTDPSCFNTIARPCTGLLAFNCFGMMPAESISISFLFFISSYFQRATLVIGFALGNSSHAVRNDSTDQVDR
mmetsp:Transcript_28674/g.46307  ORF Transcript_28674/g.46307 Transcript_28674/m.46307 type:complete len:117 (-) Transcript_28674:112-462(-)